MNKKEFKMNDSDYHQKLTLHLKAPNTEFFLNTENYRPEKSPYLDFDHALWFFYVVNFLELDRMKFKFFFIPVLKLVKVLTWKKVFLRKTKIKYKKWKTKGKLKIMKSGGTRFYVTNFPLSKQHKYFILRLDLALLFFLFMIFLKSNAHNEVPNGTISYVKVLNAPPSQLLQRLLNLIQDGLLWGCSRMVWGKKALPP